MNNAKQKLSTVRTEDKTIKEEENQSEHDTN